MGYSKAFNAPLAHPIHPVPKTLRIDAIKPGKGLGWKSLGASKNDIAMQCFTFFGGRRVFVADERRKFTRLVGLIGRFYGVLPC